MALLRIRNSVEEEYGEFDDNDDKGVSVELLDGEEEAGTSF